MLLGLLLSRPDHDHNNGHDRHRCGHRRPLEGRPAKPGVGWLRNRSIGRTRGSKANDIAAIEARSQVRQHNLPLDSAERILRKGAQLLRLRMRAGL